MLGLIIWYRIKCFSHSFACKNHFTLSSKSHAQVYFINISQLFSTAHYVNMYIIIMVIYWDRILDLYSYANFELFKLFGALSPFNLTGQSNKQITVENSKTNTTLSTTNYLLLIS